MPLKDHLAGRGVDQKLEPPKDLPVLGLELKHAASGKDYLAVRKFEDGDKLDYGVTGMRWGVRRSKAQIEADGNKPAEGKKSDATPGAKTKAKAEGWLSKTSKTVVQNVAQQSMQSIATGVANKYITQPALQSLAGNQAQASMLRYANLMAQAKAGKIGSMSDDDLKFLNARAEAMSKVSKLLSP